MVVTEISVVVPVEMSSSSVVSVVATESSVADIAVVGSPLVVRVVSVSDASIVVGRHGPACTPLTAKMASAALKREEEIMMKPNE